MQLNDICRYLDFLISDRCLYVTLHGDFVAVPELIRYNFHLNPYCRYIKTVCESLDVCIEKQCSVIKKCECGEFFGVCHAGVGEYIYPVLCNKSIVGFISVSGYKGINEKTAESKAVHFAEKNSLSKNELLSIRNAALLSEIPKKEKVDTVIRPLVFMLCNYLEMDDKYHQRENDFYSKIVRYVTSNHNTRLTMKELSEVFNCSVSTLSHLFKKRSGMSISEYIEKLRLDEAKWLLKQSSYSVAEISENLGFCNPAYFSSVFKRKFGVSPKEFSREKGF